MRTAKKNESGILNQNLCGSNEGYSTWNKGDYVGSGYTFCNMAYPGKTYARGNIFREQDMGNLMLLIFQCDDYFRYRNIELIADSHFGHFVPITFLSQWKVLCTTSILPSRKGFSSLDELSTKKVNKEEKAVLQAKFEEFLKNKARVPINGDSDSEGRSSDEDEKVYGIRKKPRTTIKSQIDLFQKKLSMNPKGHFRVWKVIVNPTRELTSTLYLHAITDSKVVYRLSNHHAALPKKTMNFTVRDPTSGKKIKESRETSQAHARFRKSMGYNDQSDAKRTTIGLSRRYYKRWTQKPLAKTIEDAIINAYLNYLLDPNCKNESWPVWLR